MSSSVIRSSRPLKASSKDQQPHQQRRLQEDRIAVRPGLTLRQQIELEHLQQLVPWSSQQPNINPSEVNAQGKQAAVLSSASSVGGATVSSSSEQGGPSQWETCVKRLSDNGAFRKIRRSSSSRALVVARLPDAFETLTQPISICKDVPVVRKLPCLRQPPPNAEPHVLTAAAAVAPWRLRDSSDKKASPSEASAESSWRPKQRCYLSRPSDVDASCFFVLIEHSQGTIEALPVSEWVAFERRLFKESEAEVEKAPREAASAVDEQIIDKLRRSVRNFDEAKQPLPSAAASGQEDELGLEREKRRQMKRILKSRGDSKTDEYITSALSVGSLRNETVSWDFEEGPRSDDEDLQDNLDVLNNADSKAEKAGADGPLVFETAEGTFSDGEDGDAQGALSSFGQKVKHLLEKAKEDEADAELHQYASEDEEEDGEEKGEGGGSASSSSVAAGVSSNAAFSAAAASAGSSAGMLNTAESLEARVVRVMQQHMGRMAVKDFMAAFKVKQKNEEFRRIQAVVHKVCKMEATEDKQKFIVLKPEYRI